MNTENQTENTEIIPEILEAKPIPKTASYVKSLRELADFYEKNEDMFLPQLELTVYGTSGKEDLALCARAFGSFKKEYTDEFIYLVKKFGDITLKVAEYREKTCVRVVVGTRKVVKEIPVATKTVEVEEEIVEWKCKESSLLGNASAPKQIEGEIEVQI